MDHAAMNDDCGVVMETLLTDHVEVCDGDDSSL